MILRWDLPWTIHFWNNWSFCALKIWGFFHELLYKSILEIFNVEIKISIYIGTCLWLSCSKNSLDAVDWIITLSKHQVCDREKVWSRYKGVSSNFLIGVWVKQSYIHSSHNCPFFYKRPIQLSLMQLCNCSMINELHFKYQLYRNPIAGGCKAVGPWYGNVYDWSAKSFGYFI